MDEQWVTLDNGYRYAYLVCVDGSVNSNKYYEMRQTGPNSFVGNAGRVDKSRKPRTYHYSMNDWDRVYRNKRNKPGSKKSYTDVTREHLQQSAGGTTSDITSSLHGISDNSVRALMERLSQYATGSIKSNYTVSAVDVTQAAIDSARVILDEISDAIHGRGRIGAQSNRFINRLFEDLYTVVPRRMGKVEEHLLPWNGFNKTQAMILYDKESQNIDVMAQQVRSQSRANVVVPGNKDVDFLSSMGIEMAVAGQDGIQLAKRMSGHSEIGNVFSVVNKSTEDNFNDRISIVNTLGPPHNRVSMYWHGSRNENWLSILDTGLLVRPPSAKHTGSMFGDGIYFSDQYTKARNYTNYSGAAYTSRRFPQAYMAIFEVNIGKQLKFDRWESSCYNLSWEVIQRRGSYDSVWGARGYSLINNEYIVYRTNQATIRYLVELM